MTKLQASVQFSRSVVSDSLRPRESQHARPPCPSPTPRVHSNSRLSSRWCHPAISSSVVPFSSCPQSLPASVFSSCKPSFLLMLFVLSCKTWNVVKPEAWLARPPSGAQPSQNSSPLLSASLALTAGSHSRSLTDQAVSWQFGSQVRGLLRFVSEA